MPFCINCGAQVREVAQFCPFCGTYQGRDRNTVGTKPLQMEHRGSSQQTIAHQKRADAGAKTNAGVRSSSENIAELRSQPRNSVRRDETSTLAPHRGQDAAMPIFTPDTGTNASIPTFTPPKTSRRSHFDGPVCYHHSDEPAAGQCARCGKYVCQECIEVYTVSTDEYKNKCLCYDCCKKIVAENLEALKQQKSKIIGVFVMTIIGLIVGIVLAVGAPFVVVVLAALWCGSIGVVFTAGWAGYKKTGRLAGFVGGLIGGLVVGPFKTVQKIIQCIIYLSKTSHFIEQDSAALKDMDDFMEYTLVRNRNRGVNLETLISQDSSLYHNSYANTLLNYGEEEADARLRRGTTRIAENGEIIRSFSA